MGRIKDRLPSFSNKTFAFSGRGSEMIVAYFPDINNRCNPHVSRVAICQVRATVALCISLTCYMHLRDHSQPRGFYSSLQPDKHLGICTKNH